MKLARRTLGTGRKEFKVLKELCQILFNKNEVIKLGEKILQNII